jgi:hypothetical protein
MLEQEIRSGLYDPDTVRALRQDQRAMRQIMRDTNIDGTQRAQALGNLQSRMRMSRSTGKVQPMMQQMGPAALQTKPPMTEAEYFSDEKNYANAYAAAQARLEAAGPDTPVTPENIQAQMHNDYLAKQKFLQGLSQPQPNAPAGPQAPTAPDGGSRGGRGVILEAGTPQASYTGGQPTFGASPVMAQGGMGAPVGPGAYQPGSYTSPQVFGAANVLANPAQPPQQQPATQYLPDGTPYNANLVDMAYDAVNPERSAGTNYFDPENPEYARMRGADQSIVNPQKETLGKPGGRYGLGMIDYGINPATGNRVTASIRPGGTMPEYDEPVGPPGTAMGGGRGGLTIMGGRKKPAPAATAEVSPGGTPVNAGLAAAAPVSISRDDWRVKWAEMIAANPSASRDHKGMAADILKNAGLSEGEVAAMEAKGTAVQSERTSGEDERNAYETVKSQRKSAGETENAKKLLKANGWTDKEIENLGLGRPTRKPGPPKPTSKETEEMISYLQSGRASEAERQVIEGILRAEGVDFDAKLRLGGKEASTSATASPGGDWKKYSDSTRRSGKAAPTSSSLLGQLEQAETAPAGSVPPSPASGAKQGQEELRTWTSVDGKTFDGSIVEGSLEAAAKQPIGQQVITVKTKSGKVFNVPIERFSEEDRAFMEAKYKINFQLGYTDKNDPELKYLKIAPGKAEMQSKVKTGGKYNQKTGPRSEQYQTPGPFNDSIPKEFYTPPSYLERNRNRVN